MRAISWIAVSVFKESVRDRVPYNLALFAVLLIASSFLLGQLTAGQDVKIIKDLGLAAIAVFGLFIAIFIGIGLVSKEVERRSIYALLAKPISRPQFIVGKYAGLVLTLAVNVAVMTVALYAVLAVLTYLQTPEARAAWDAPGDRPAAAEGGRADLRRADDRDGDRAVLLHLLDAAARRRADVRHLHRRPLQHRPEELRSHRRLAPGGLAGARRLPRGARLLGLRRQDRGRARTAGGRRLPRGDHGATGSPTSPGS